MACWTCVAKDVAREREKEILTRVIRLLPLLSPLKYQGSATWEWNWVGHSFSNATKLYSFPSLGANTSFAGGGSSKCPETIL